MKAELYSTKLIKNLLIMLKLSSAKFHLIKRLATCWNGYCYISTCKLKGDKAKIFIKALKSLDTKPCGPENPRAFLQTVGSVHYKSKNFKL
ncbi:hypothetical protein Anas_02613 [Armadillidium nasatum]|uniref:Uncharacterized protein n=1 Tax=Armadillidium nasatum TaxID=96803 RepID=A0A5N5TI12_9CRUS|nr:hypothetical protein Anas_02613 [Armadillidium nasatum]